MKVGDLIRFPETGYTAIVLEFTDSKHVRMLITQQVSFRNPTWMSVSQLKRCGEVVSNP